MCLVLVFGCGVSSNENSDESESIEINGLPKIKTLYNSKIYKGNRWLL